MSYEDITLKNKVSTHVEKQMPEFIQADHPLFSKFVKAYYQFLESAEITFSETNNYIRQETQSVNFLLDENEDQIVLEDSESKFTVGEVITGQTSGATATQVRLIVQPDSNDVIAVRNQVLEIDLINSTISANVDTVATGSSGAGVGVATTSSYTGATNTTGSTSTSSTSTSSSSSSSSSSGY